MGDKMMKSVNEKVGVLVCSFVLAVAGCSSSSSNDGDSDGTDSGTTDSGTTDGGTTDSGSSSSDFKVGLVTDVGRVDDGTFNQYAYEGGVQAASELGVAFDYIESSDLDSYDGNIRGFAEDGYDLIVTLGFNMGAPTVSIAAEYPELNFATVDWADDSENGAPANFRGLLFAEDQAGYLAGVLAGGMTTSKNVGVMAGIPFPPLVKFANGYAQGVRSVCADCTVQIAYAETFSSSFVGETVSTALIGNGADVVFAAAGAAGGGAIKYAASNEIWAIGVDMDEYVTTFAGGDVPGAEYLLSSAMKKVDTAVYDTIKLAVEGNFTNQIGDFNVGNGGVGLADYHASESSIPDEVKASVSAAEAGLGDGTISTGVGPMGHMEDEAHKVDASCFNGETGEAMDCCLDSVGYPIPSWSCG